MDKLREWGFPVTLIVGWMAAAAYTVSLLIAPPEKSAPPRDPQSIAESNLPAS
jgi:hypothetical protein